MILRDYQQRAIDDLYNWFLAGYEGNPCLVLPTGSGKSHIVAALCKDAITKWPETRVLMLTHVKELIEQNAEKMYTHWPDAPLGIYSAGIGRRELHQPITFAGIQSVRNKAAQIDHIDLVIIDECFSGSTKISTPNGDVNIDKVRCGDVVLTQCGFGIVEAVSAKPATETFLLEFDDGTKTECTGNHPFFTPFGWKAARKLVIGESFFSIQAVRLLWEKICSLGEKGRNGEGKVSFCGESMEQAINLFNILCKEIKKPNEQSSGSIEDEGKDKGDKTQTYQAWRKRALASFASVGASSCSGGGLGIGDNNCNQDEASWSWLSNLLQNRHSQSKSDDWDRSGWGEPRVVGTTGERQKKDRVPYFTRLVNISSVQRKSPIPVFNLQVSGHPSYFADGKLVHNCHLVNHKDTGGYRNLLGQLKRINPHLRVVGLTATPYRLGHGMITDEPAIFNALIEPVTIEELIFKKHLAPLRSKVTTTKLDTAGVAKRGGEFVEGELQKAVNTKDQNVRVVSEVIALAEDRQHWLFFCTGVSHAENVCEILNYWGVPARCVTGDTPKKEREAIINDFKTGKIRALTNANVLTTGFDYPDIDLIAMLRPTMSPGLYLQMAGRGMRPKSHTDHCMVLDFAKVVATHGPITNVQPPKKGGSGDGVAPVKVCDKCGELCALAARVCSACGEEFPAPEAKKLKLHNDDIMGDQGTEMTVSDWSWRRHVSQASGKLMVSVTYYGGLSDPPITEYLPLLHAGFAGEKALGTLYYIANKAQSVLNQINEVTDSDAIDYVAAQMNQGFPPVSIEYKRDGKFFRVVKRTW